MRDHETKDYMQKACRYSVTNLSKLAVAYNTLPERIIQLIEMDCQNRIAIMSEPILDPLPGTDQHDTDVYCPNCNKTLSGGYPDDETGARTVHQCPHCGQPINPYHIATTLHDFWLKESSCGKSNNITFLDKNGSVIDDMDYNLETQVLSITNPKPNHYNVILNVET